MINLVGYNRLDPRGSTEKNEDEKHMGRTYLDKLKTTLVEDDKHEIDDVLICTISGKVITRSQIEYYTDEYKNTLFNPEMIYKKSACFTGLLNYVFKRLVIPILPKQKEYDYILLDSIFNNIYIPLCNSYGYMPNLYTFCYISNMDIQYIKSLLSSKHSHGDRVNINTLRIIKNWLNVCESNNLSNVMDHNSIGSMFVLKSVYGYSETQTVRIEAGQTTPKIDEMQIQKMGNFEELPPSDDMDF